ncbi:hypothetical protein RN001_006109 [Aquatica leii]|uniref:Uncharacterized protein n=1 Tax=Aquatica leii TaxID=1421715 RepID=A0AAN7P7F5_9COLE|nr:hypothetical protein RN001_006109 [Aquatica leii]
MKIILVVLFIYAAVCLGLPTDNSKKNCRCIPFQQCTGEVDNSVYCQPWYGMSCCIFKNRAAADERIKTIVK